MMRERLYSTVLQSDKEPGRELEARIQRVLRQRVAFDRAAEDAIYSLDRFAGALYEPDIAVLRVREAASYFGPDDVDGLVRRPIEYYRCLVTHSALLIGNARYALAVGVSEAIDALVASYEPGVFPQLDYSMTNALLA